ncbi:hypothetical protein KR767_08445 [Luteibacter anthropi]|uniref:hypothetical protein n=1 Tax=Luteibacter anthropi TaxID=564369 RepID=UPI0020323AE9|nr:hypothetical protein [Luteibacter anthropi]URX64059.1 hypothetical protein KR767_08445 [Luteibacter anthropi]
MTENRIDKDIMDTLPPPPPPSIVSSTQQEAIDAYGRIASLGHWLTEQQQLMPSLPDAPTQADRDAFDAALHAYWNTSVPQAPGYMASRRTVLIGKLASAMLDTATLRHLDGSMDGPTLELIRSFVAEGTTPPPHMQVHEIIFGDIVYAGALIAFDDRKPETVVLFTPGRGWDVFDGLQKAHAHVDQWVRRSLAWRAGLPGFSRSETRPDLLPHATSRRSAGSPGDMLVTRQLAVQQEKIQQAWVEFALERSVAERSDHLADRVDEALRLTDMFDAGAILTVREALLDRAVSEARLAKLPSDDMAAFQNVDGVRAAWHEAAANHLEAVRAGVARRALQGIDPVPDLHDYAVDMLGSILTAMGVDEPAPDICITLDRKNDPIARIESLPSLLEGPSSQQTTLLDLAYENTPPPGLGTFTAQRKNGQAIPTLDDTNIRALVRGFNLHNRYLSLLSTELRTGEKARIRRATAIESLAARMRYEAVESRLSGFLGEHPTQKHLALSQRGWQWVTAVLDSPESSGRRKVHDLEVATRLVTYQGVAVRDVVEIALKDIPVFYPVDLMSSRVYYTPGAPDGASFREFASWEEAQQLFFRNPAFVEYLLDRLPGDVAEVPENGIVRRFKAHRRTDWILGSTEPEGYTPTATAFVTRNVENNILEAMYDQSIDLIESNARALTRSTAEADTRSIIDLLHLRPAEQVAGRFAMGVLTAPFHVAPASWRVYDHLKQGDYVNALAQGAEAYSAAVSMASTRSAFQAATAPTIRFRATDTGMTVRALPRPANAPVTKPQLQGAYRVDGHFALAVEGRLYPAHYDMSKGTVYADMAHPMDAKAAHAALRFHHARWQHPRTAPGRPESLPATESVAGTAGGRRDLSLYQEYLVQLEKEFPDALERQNVLHQMDRELVGLPPLRTLSRDQRIRFERAWAKAEQVTRTSEGGSVASGGQLRKLTESEIPECLWFYGQGPLYKSSFVRSALHQRGPVNHDWAALIGELQAPGLVGIRATTLTPDVSNHSIGTAMAIPDFVRRLGFAVEVRIKDIIRQQPPGLLGIEVYEVVGKTDQYIIRPKAHNLLEMGRGQFSLIEQLPI